MNLVEHCIDLLSQLIEIPTVNPPGTNYDRMAKLLKSYLEELGFEVRIIEIPESYLDQHYPYAPQHRGYPRYLVLARNCSDRIDLHVNGHYDVVPPGDGWSYDPFKATIVENRVYGRGATDMKSGIACMLTALRYVVERNELRGCVELAFVPDEESGGIGTKYLVEVLGVAPRYVLIAEPTTSERIAVGHKGMVRGVVKVFGRQGHASRPWRAVNAFEKGCLLVSKILEPFHRYARSKPSTLPFDEEEAKFVTVALGGWVRTSAMKDNVIPGEFSFSFDMRTIPEVGNEEAFRFFENLVKNVAKELGIDAVVEKRIDIPPASTPLDSPLLSFVKSIASSILGFEPRIFVNTGRYDLVFYRSKGSHVVVYGPGAKGTAHAVNEYVTIEELEKFVRIYVDILRRLEKLRELA